jgi:hypothetical protein
VKARQITAFNGRQRQTRYSAPCLLTLAVDVADGDPASQARDF